MLAIADAPFNRTGSPGLLAASWPHEFARENTGVNVTRLVEQLTAPRRYAFVRVADLHGPQLRVPFQLSLFALYQRLLETGATRFADLVLVYCSAQPPETHPAYKLKAENCDEIDRAVGSGKNLKTSGFYRLLAWRLVQYTHILILDEDVHVAGNMLGAFQFEAPATVRWESPRGSQGPWLPDAGVMLIRPSMEMYEAALSWLLRLRPMHQWRRTAMLRNMLSPWGVWYNKSTAVPPDPGPVCVDNEEPQFTFMFFNALERTRFGPLHELPFQEQP